MRSTIPVRDCVVMLFALIAFTCTVHTQSMLELDDQLPPFLLSARLLNNGHFSITTNYTSTTKTLIYREDGTGNRPVNYTSHIHVKVDDVVFQLPFEVDRTTDLPPPPNPMEVLKMFRDTVQHRPRINALMLAKASNGDSIRVTFTMEPVARPSGAFIRLSVALENAGFTQHNVGVLMLVDTKIGTNDRAPIGTAFGYSGIESEYRKATPPGIPEFWIAIEGTPLAPGLTARGNLSASELIEPDRFLFGNWVDDNGAGIPGLYKVLWDERVPSGLSFTDSAILLLWEQRQLAARSRRIHAATEIGLVDSLIVSFGTGSGGGGGGGGGSLGVAGPGSCLSVATAVEDTCNKRGYTPYSPDTVASLYLVTNTGKTDIHGLNLLFESLPPGLQAVALTQPVVPSDLIPDQTGVSVLPIVARPRLYATSYDVPIAFVDAIPDTILRDTLCITVPGILAKITGKKTVLLPVCPGEKDTFQIPVDLEGIRCLPVFQASIISPAGAPAKIVSPLPLLPAGGTGAVLIVSSPLVEGSTDVQVRIVVRDWESLVDGDTTWVDVVDTVTVTVIGKNAEVQALLAGDTLNLPTICVRDTSMDSMQVQNVGGCDATLSTITFSNTAGGVFSIDPRTPIPQTIARAARGQVLVRASSPTPGTFVGELEITSIARPGVIHVPVRVVIDKPGYDLSADTLFLDTVCPNVTSTAFFGLLNNTGCDVRIDSVRQTGADTIAISPPDGFFIGPRSNVSLSVILKPSVEGPFRTSFRVYSQEGGSRDVVVVGWTAQRTASAPTTRDVGRVRVGTSTSQPTSDITVTNTGSQPITITGVQFNGQHASEFSVQLDAPAVFPFVLAPSQTVLLHLFASPRAIGTRTAIATVVFLEKLCASVDVIAVQAYGVQPLLDIERHDVQNGAICIGGVADTVMRMRNLGNEMLHITGITCSGSLQPTIPQPLPITLDSGASIDVLVHLSTPRIGNETCECQFATDADWFTQEDTTVRMGVTGIVCGTLWADSMSAYVGTLTPTTVRLEPDERTTFTRDELAGAIDAYGATTQLRLVADGSVVRFGNQVSGMMQGAQATATPTSVTVRAQGIPVPTASVFTTVDVDALLGMSNRTPVTVFVDSLANGLHALRIHDGLIRSEYCAFDQRRVQVAPGSIIGARAQGSAIAITAFADAQVYVAWYDLVGRLVERTTIQVHSGELTTVPMPSGGYAMLVASVQPEGSATVQTVKVLR